MSATNISQIFNYTATAKSAWMVNGTATFQYYDKTDFTQITPGMFSNGSYVAFASAHTGNPASASSDSLGGTIKKLFLTVTNQTN
jgi:hypothetical protein